MGADINDMNLNTILNLDPSLKQIVRGYKNGDKTLDVILTDFWDLLQEPTILSPLQVDDGKPGSDSDHKGVQVLPRTNLSGCGAPMREKVCVRPFPESIRAAFSLDLQGSIWRSLQDIMSTTELVDKFETTSRNLVDKYFPEKLVSVGPTDLPYFTEQLRSLKRTRLRAYNRHGRRSPDYLQAKNAFDVKLQAEAIKYRKKVIQEMAQEDQPTLP